MYAYLRERIAFVRDGYSATVRERRKLYMWLKLNEGWRMPSIKEKLGRVNYEWLEGLVVYGDEHDWLQQGMREAARGVVK